MREVVFLNLMIIKLFSTTNWLDETDSISTPSERNIKKIEELNIYSSTRWDVMLNYLLFRILSVFIFFYLVCFAIPC